MSVAVKNYLEDCLLFPEDGRKRHVTAVSGGATGNLRWVWHLNSGDNGKKDREDDRHHAVDAAIIAACSESTVRKVADASKLGRETFKHLRQSRLADTQPWPTFAEEVVERREQVIPTRMADHGVTGRLFEDFVYRLERIRETGYAEISRKDGDKRKHSVEGNYIVQADGSIKLLDKLAYLRLWHDPNSGKQGKWYVEPVYLAEVSEAEAPDYVPRYARQKQARTIWNEVPESAKQEVPLKLYRSDVLIVGNHIARYWSFDIGGGSFDMRRISDSKLKDKSFPSISKWTNEMKVLVLQEDCLGHCYDSMLIDQDSSTYSLREP